MPDYEKQKRNAAVEAASYVKTGMVIGIGTGTTARYLIEELGRRVSEENLKIKGVCTSKKSEELARAAGIEISENPEQIIDLTIDGADQVNLHGTLIKGGGGALLREKIVAYNSKEMYVIVDSRKIDDENFGSFPLPVEVVPFLHRMTLENLRKICPSTDLRKNSDGTLFITDNGNYIADMKFGRIRETNELEKKIKSIPGVVDVGLFNNIADKIFEGNDDGCNIYVVSEKGRIEKEKGQFK
ncbi:ribose-5-phosphate isomerase [Thermoplasma volcanium GSS1]|uniref:Ribose-5-phosphate isomerase A n=1 Tax=Thermoplasma volcanium (strain ATCC 51530 / DSM 4299 / JCM 9571 / NBRC 15438 / GSS1) TaxID=273116 RepID=RPIA_THEVO|nr:ribose 5-phosphate isomerase A [Thermoplasma volcanium]Q97AU2.1 RecName: Full=Ribose-5-phosphate isomerase A; AltName: Full=Phosphoriboisomerase A; Short=PRI [Thermoplasma volcanium GSS1]BAB59859.1 ribose-5-phosphate isomerase [Thermoplasma volcanium GSS1]